MKKITKFTALVVALSLTLVLAGCQNPASDETTKEETKVTQPAPAPVPKTYTVTFITNGGSTVDSQTVTEGNKASRPAEVTKAVNGETSYIFDNWYTSTDEGITLSATAFDFNTPVTANTVLYAKWTEKSIWEYTKADSEEKAVGDIIFTNGKLISYVDFNNLNSNVQDALKSKAMAIIFYKGTELNDGDDTSTTRTLGVGLKHLKHNENKRWAYFNDSSDHADGYVMISELLCDPDDYTSNRKSLTPQFTGNKKRNGSNNLQKMSENTDINDANDESKYPVLYFAKNYGTRNNLTNYENGWYLPTIAELYQIYKCINDGIDISAISKNCGGDDFPKSKDDTADIFWSSSQATFIDNGTPTTYYVYAFSFGYKQWFRDRKFVDYYAACAIREF